MYGVSADISASYNQATNSDEQAVQAIMAHKMEKF